MNKIFIGAILLIVILGFGCVGAPNREATTNAGGSEANNPSSGTAPVARPAPEVTGTAIIRDPAQTFARCNSDCTILGENAAVGCRVGCILEYAEAERSVSRCNDIYSVPRVDEYQLADTYFNGCLDVVGGAMGSIEPCSQIRASSGSVARKNACISAVAAESRQPTLCDSMIQENTDPDPRVQELYEQSFRQIIQDCRDSSQ